VISNDDLPWDEWNRIGMAIWRSTGGSEEGYYLGFAPWSAKSGRNNPDATRQRWNSYSRSPPTENRLRHFGAISLRSRPVLAR
jgi:hypothetical protein